MKRAKGDRAPCLAGLILLLAIRLVGESRTAQAASDEIQVYLEDVNAPGEVGLDVHVNYVLSGRTTPEWPGELPPDHVLQVTPEFSLGATRSLELGLYLPTAAGPGGALYGNGVKVRLKYIPPRGRGARFFWGANVELGRVARRVSEESWTLELRPILGYRSGRFLAAINPILGLPIRHDTLGNGELEPALKLAYDVGHGLTLGLEHYAALGSFDSLLPHAQQEQVVYAVADYERHGVSLNLGVGRGLTSASGRWVVKAILGFRGR
jgi:hypothetical protein